MRKVLGRRPIRCHRPAAEIPPLPWPHLSSTHASRTRTTIATHQTTSLLLLLLLVLLVLLLLMLVLVLLMLLLLYDVGVRQLLLVLLQRRAATILNLLLLERSLTSQMRLPTLQRVERSGRPTRANHRRVTAVRGQCIRGRKGGGRGSVPPHGSTHAGHSQR